VQAGDAMNRERFAGRMAAIGHALVQVGFDANGAATQLPTAMAAANGDDAAERQLWHLFGANEAVRRAWPRIRQELGAR
jgi:hypothetical protein